MQLTNAATRAHILDVGDEITRTINQLLDQGYRHFVLNLERVSALDSAGLGDVVRAYVAASRRGGSLKLDGLNQRLQDVLSLTNLTGLSVADPLLDPFNPNLRDQYRTAILAACGVTLVALILVIVWSWGGLSGGH